MKKNLWKALKYSDFVLFFLCILLKLYLFTRQSSGTFFQSGISSYVKQIFLVLFTGASYQTIANGLFFISIGTVLIISAWMLLLPFKTRMIVYTIVNLLLSTLLFADLLYYRYFSVFISVVVFSQLNQIEGIHDSVTALIKVSDIVFFFDIFLWTLFIIYYFRKKPTGEKKKTFRIRFASFILLTVIGSVFITLSMQAHNDKGTRELLSNTYNTQSVGINNAVGILGFHYYDVKNNLIMPFFKAASVPTKDKNNIRKFVNQNAKNNEEKTPYAGIAKGKNLIVVQMEAFQSFMFDKKIKGKEVTPFLNQLKDQSLYFENFYHQVGQGRTSDADLLTNTSLYPVDLGSVFVRFAHNNYDSLAKVLKQNGYSATAFHANDGSFWNRDAIYPVFGYDKFYEHKSFKGPIIGMGIDDKDFLTQSVQYMKKNQQPFYSFLVTLSSHYPYTMPKKYKNDLDVSEFKNSMFRDYLQSAHYVDQSIEVFVNELKKAGLWDNSVVVFYGDHDALVMKDGGQTEQFATGKTDHYSYLEDRNKIPLIIHLPGETKGKDFTNTGGQIDTKPTLMHLLGIPQKESVSLGQNLLQGKNNLVAFRFGESTNGTNWYETSKDGKFENGKCYDYKTRKQTQLSACKNMYNESQIQLHYSDEINQNNLLNDIKKKK